jgi:hypothetical protein
MQQGGGMSDVASPDITADTPAAKAPLTRQRAALLHFLISVVVFSAVIVPLLIMWYPPPLFFADGGWNVIQIAAGVDVFLGPMLTLVVFKHGKKGLKVDLTVIALLQIAALAWGVHLMYQERPLFLAFAGDRFGAVTEGQIDSSKRPLEELLKLGGDNPVRVMVKLPDDPIEAMQLRMAQLARGNSLFSAADHYEAMTPDNLRIVYGKSVDVQALLQANPQYQSDYDALIRKTGLAAGDLAFLPLMARYHNVIVVLRRADGSMAGSLNIPPPTNLLRAKSQKTGEK